MQASQRVLINTIAQYVRTIINMVLSLYTIRIVLIVLGENDYGIYTLIAGIVSLLAFITNSLMITTQRFVSFYQGKGDLSEQKSVFNNSLIIHIAITIFVALLLECISPLLFNGFLNIPVVRTQTAIVVYQFVIAIIIITFVASPYRALLVSHENILYISIIDVVDGILKILFAIMMCSITFDKLIYYGASMLIVQLFNFFALSIYCHLHYKECVLPRTSGIKTTYIKQMSAFAGWSVYSTGCIVGRQQGIAIILNKFFSTAVNAAYGIAFQIASYTNFLSSSLVNAIVPQIVKSEGAGDRQRALKLSVLTCKFMFFLLSAICIPCIFEIDNILVWWLDNVPKNSSLFCIMVMCTSMADALTVGLAHINQAIGKIGLYSLVVNTPKLITLPVALICLLAGCPIISVAITFFVIELLSAIIRIIFINKTAGLNISEFLKNVIAMELLPIGLNIAVCYLFVHYIDFPFRFFVTILISMVLYGLFIYSFGLKKTERILITGVVNSFVKKHNIDY